MANLTKLRYVWYINLIIGINMLLQFNWYTKAIDSIVLLSKGPF